MSTPPAPLLLRLARLRRAIGRRGLASAALAVLVSGLALLPLSWALAGSEGWPRGTMLPLALWAAGITLGLGWGALLLKWTRQWRDVRRVAESLERHANLPEGAVRAQVELQEAEDGSSSLVQAGEKEVLLQLDATRAEEHSSELHRARRTLLRVGGIAAGMVVLAGILAVASPDRARLAWFGLAHPVASMQPPPLPPLSLQPEGGAVVRGEPLELQIGAPERLAVEVEHDATGVTTRSGPLEVLEGVARFDLPPVESRTRVQVEAPDGAATETFEFWPVDPLTLDEVEFSVLPPDWTGAPRETHVTVPDRVQVLEGSELRIRAHVPDGVDSVLVLRDDAADQGGGPRGAEAAEPGSVSGVEDGRVDLRWVPASTGAFRLELESNSSLPSRVPGPIQVEVIPNVAPMVSLRRPDGEDFAPVPGSLRLPLFLEAVHAWGVDWVELEVEPAQSGGDVVRDRTPIALQSRVEYGFELDLSAFGVPAGGTLLIRARAADASPGPLVGVSQDLVIQLPGAREMGDAAASQVRRSLDEARDLEEAMGRGLSQMEEALLQARSRANRSQPGTPAGEDERRQLADDVGDRIDRARRMESVASTLAESSRHLSSGSDDASAGERLSEVASNLDGPDSRQRRDALEALLDRLASDDLDLGDLADIRAELVDHDADAVEALQGQLEELERAAVESEFEVAAREARSWADDVEAGVDSEELAERAAELEQRLRDLQAELDGSGEASPGSEAQASLQEAMESMNRAEAALDRATSARSEGDNNTAEGQDAVASSEAQAAATALEEARMEWLEEWEDRLRDSFLRIARDALTLARHQSDSHEAMRQMRASGVSSALASQVAMLESVRGLVRAATPLNRQAGEAGRSLAEVGADAIRFSGMAVDRLQNGQVPSGGPAAMVSESRNALNLLAVRAMEAMEAVGEDARGPMAEGEGGEPDESADMDALADQQAGVNQETGAMAEEAASGEGTSAERMDNAAAGQQAVADALGGLAQEAVADDGDGDGIRFDEMSEEAGSLAEALRDGRLDPEVLDRQAGLLERLLEAGRTLERGRSEDREGEAPGLFQRLPVTPLPDGLLEGLGLPLPSARVMESLGPGERRLVRDYLDRLARPAPPSALPDPGEGGS